ncbi:MAG: hypothetical protein Q9191_004212 [Dirinaria sp. TL-2023a]
MKILTKEEEQAHYNATLKGGIGGGVVGLALGAVGVYGATVRYPAFRQLTVPLRAFLLTSASTFCDEGYRDETSRARAEAEARKTNYEKFMSWGKQNRYPIVGASWVVSMAVALGIVGRSPYLSTQQKLVQARVYAQGLTVAVLIATAAFEIGDQRSGEGKYETIRVVDPNDPEHKHLIDKKVHKEEYVGEDQWKDMVEAEERREKARKQEAHEQALKDEAAHHKHKSKHSHSDKKQKDDREQPDKGKTARG